MTKAELVDFIAEGGDFTKRETETFLKLFTDAIKQAAKKGDKLSLVGFGTFKPVTRAERNGINPQTKEALVIPAYKTLIFSPSKQLKQFIS